MIYGIGADIVAVARMDRLRRRYGDGFAGRILATDELADYRANRLPAHFLAKRFAAKEALSKALGTGLRYPVSLRNISVVHDERGKPVFHFTAALAQWLVQQGVRGCHLSVSDEKETACAFVVLEK